MARNQRHFLVFDIETDGLDPDKHEIVQLAAKAITYDFEPHEAGEFHIILKPLNPELAEPKAIEIIGQELWAKAQNEGEHPKVGLRKFKEFCDRLNYKKAYYTAPILVGFNNTAFDNIRLETAILKHGVVKNRDSLPWAYTSKDVLSQMTDLFGRDNLPNHKLDTFANLLGMSRSTSLHDALEDVKITSDIFCRYMKYMCKIRNKLKIENNSETVEAK